MCMSRGDFHVVKEITEVFHRHGDSSPLLRTVTDELVSFPFCLWIFHELLEPSSLDEEFNGILQMDPVIGDVPMAFVESTVFCFVDPLPLLRWSL
jgi:hypothetical protein